MDIHVQVPAVPYRDLAGKMSAESSRTIRNRVAAARGRQLRRFARTKIFSNAQMQSRHVRAHCRIDAASEKLLEAKLAEVLSRNASVRSAYVTGSVALGIDGDRSDVDVVLLNSVSLKMIYQVLNSGKLIYAVIPEKETIYAIQKRKEYFDFRYYLDRERLTMKAFFST